MCVCVCVFVCVCVCVCVYGSLYDLLWVVLLHNKTLILVGIPVGFRHNNSIPKSIIKHTVTIIKVVLRAGDAVRVALRPVAQRDARDRRQHGSRYVLFDLLALRPSASSV